MINCSTYYFEDLKRGYYQYPLDSFNAQFKSYLDHFNSDSQIVVHRHPNLMFYTYMRKLSINNVKGSFGISIVINGLETSSIKSLFRLFERVFQNRCPDQCRTSFFCPHDASQLLLIKGLLRLHFISRRGGKS